MSSLKDIINAIPVGILNALSAAIFVDLERRIIFATDNHGNLSGVNKNEAIGKIMYEPGPNGFAGKDPKMKVALLSVLETGIQFKSPEPAPYTKRDELLQFLEREINAIKNDNEKIIGAIITVNDVTEKVLALSMIKKLEGILPICMHCKKIRDDEGKWNQLETFISLHSDAQFSHGICQNCLQAHYPECLPNPDKT